MANTFLTVDDITLAALDVFENEAVAVKLCSRKLEDGFGKKGAQRGDTCRIRKPVQFTVRDGQAWTGQDIEEQYETLTVDKQKGIDFSMSSKERKLDLNSLTNQILRPAIVRLANHIDADVIETLTKATFHAVGTPGTTPSTTQPYIDANALLSDQACPKGRGERNLLINPTMEGDIAYALRDYFNPSRKISQVFDSAEMDGVYAAGLTWHMDQNVYTHTVGTYTGTPRVNGASQSGANLITDGWSGSDNLTVGDRFTIADVFMVNPVTKATLGTLQRFVVTAAVSDDAGGAMTIAISPSIVGSGAYQNVSALPANDALLTVFGTTANVYSQGIAFNPEAITLAIVPLERPDGVNQASMKYDEKSGIGLRYIEWYDGDTDLWKSRFDVVYGMKVQRPEWAVAVAAE